MRLNSENPSDVFHNSVCERCDLSTLENYLGDKIVRNVDLGGSGWENTGDENDSHISS